jgi:hypothetical protein
MAIFNSYVKLPEGIYAQLSFFFSASAMGIYGMYGQSEAKQNLAHKIDMMVSALQGPEWCCLSLLTGRRPAKGCRHPGKVHVNGNSTGLASKN